MSLDMVDKQKIKEDLIEKGVLFVTNEDVLNTLDDNKRLKISIIKKLSYTSLMVLLLMVLTGLLTYELSAIRVGDIGVYNPSGETTILNPAINPRPSKYDAYRFATEAAISIRTFWFSTYYADLERLEPLFTNDAYNDFLTNLQVSGLLTRVKAESLNVTAALAENNTINAANRYKENVSFYYVRVRLILRLENLSGEDEFMREEFYFELKEVDRGLSKYGLLISSMGNG